MSKSALKYWPSGERLSDLEIRQITEIFDSEWYTSVNSIDANSDQAIQHYLEHGIAQSLEISPLFSASHYIAQNEDVVQHGIDPLRHYLQYGAREGRSPHPLFDVSHYLSNVSNRAEASANPLIHFIKTGNEQKISPFPIFDYEWYGYSVQDSSVGKGHLYRHFIISGLSQNLSPHYLFDPNFYLTNYTDVAGAKIPAFRHYMEIGAREGRTPHSLFDVEYYLAQVPGDKLARENALLHFVKWGNRGQISPYPLFNHQWYKSYNPDLAVPRLDLFKHFILNGIDEDRNVHPIFDKDYYRRSNPDVDESGMSMLRHYLCAGAAEGRDPNAMFRVKTYLRQLTDESKASENPPAHFIKFGAARKIAPTAMFDYAWYKQETTDETGINEPYLHFIATGDKSLASPHPLFDPVYYMGSNPVLNNTRGPAQHFSEIGGRLGLNPHPLFDVKNYEVMHPQYRFQFSNPLEHYLNTPKFERRHAHPLFDEAYQTFNNPQRDNPSFDPLSDYVLHRSRIDPALLQARKTIIPTPERAILPVLSDRTACNVQPRVSILLPCYNSPEEYLRIAVNSVRSQRYTNWELIIVNDGSKSETWQIIENLRDLDHRITAVDLKMNVGIAEATNRALELATGEYIAMLDHDDVLLPDALSETVGRLVSVDGDAAYSDQAYVSRWGTLESTFYKPSWSPALMLGVMYVGHLLVVRRTIAVELLFDSKFNNVQDFEFMLRVSERTKRIVHVPHILYHWRIIPGSIASDANAKGRIEPLQAAAVNAHLRRIGMSAVAKPSRTLSHRLVIEPLARKEYPAIDAILINGNDKPSTIAELLAAEGREERRENMKLYKVTKNAATVEKDIQNFDSFRTIQEAINAGKSEFVLFVDERTSVVASRWLEYLLMYAELPDTALVGPSIYTGENTVVAAGLVLSKEIGLAPAMRGLQYGEDGYAGSLSCDREVISPATAIVLVKRDTLEKIGPMNSVYSSSIYAIAELGIKARKMGFRNISVAKKLITVASLADYDPNANQLDVLLFKDAFELDLADGDPYYSRNFASADASYR